MDCLFRYSHGMLVRLLSRGKAGWSGWTWDITMILHMMSTKATTVDTLCQGLDRQALHFTFTRYVPKRQCIIWELTPQTGSLNHLLIRPVQNLSPKHTLLVTEEELKVLLKYSGDTHAEDHLTYWPNYSKYLKAQKSVSRRSGFKPCFWHFQAVSS